MQNVDNIYHRFDDINNAIKNENNDESSKRRKIKLFDDVNDHRFDDINNTFENENNDNSSKRQKIKSFDDMKNIENLENFLN